MMVSTPLYSAPHIHKHKPAATKKAALF